jgi:hypothetical protein
MKNAPDDFKLVDCLTNLILTQRRKDAKNAKEINF